MPSASFAINGTTVPAAVAVAYGATVTLTLLSTTGVASITWRIAGSSAATLTNPTITPAGAPSGATASFTHVADPGGGVGASLLVECSVLGTDGETYVAYGIAGTANAVGVIPLSAGEKYARHATHGYLDVLNRLALSPLSGGSITGDLAVSGTVTAGTGLVATTGGVTATAGNLTALAGNVAATLGSVAAGTTVTAGTTMTAGTGITATTGNISATAGNMSASGTVTAGTGVTATTGNIAASSGNVSASGTVTGGTGVTATTGNVTATAGKVTSGTDVEATSGKLVAVGTDPALYHDANPVAVFFTGTGVAEPNAPSMSFARGYNTTTDASTWKTMISLTLPGSHTYGILFGWAHNMSSAGKELLEIKCGFSSTGPVGTIYYGGAGTSANIQILVSGGVASLQVKGSAVATHGWLAGLDEKAGAAL
jgi:hypothetical protein